VAILSFASKKIDIKLSCKITMIPLIYDKLPQGN